MGLPGDNITTWAQMQQDFNNKYRDFGRSKYTKDKIFRMTICHYESLEDYEERFQLSYKTARYTLDPESLKLVLLRGVREDLMDTLYMITGGDVYQLPYEDIKMVFRNHSKIARKKGRGSQPMVSTSSSNLSIKGEIGNMLEDFKSDKMQTLALKLDTMNIKRKQEEAERALAIFCPRCTGRHPKNEFPLNCIQICSGCEENHSTDKCPSLPRLKVVYQGAKEVTKNLCYINQRRPPGPRPYQQGMQGPSHAYYNPNQATNIPSWGPPTHPSLSTPPPWSYTSQYQSQPASQSFQPYGQPQHQWNAPTQGWRPQFNNVPALLPPPPTQP